MLSSATARAAGKAGKQILKKQASTQASKTGSSRVSTIIFDVDDTLYDVSSGFTEHRNGEVIWRYMVERFGFESTETARAVRDKYFAIYHSTAKALTVAQTEGEFPPGAPAFDAGDMSRYWVDNLDYDKLWGRKDRDGAGSAGKNLGVEESKAAKSEFRDALARCPARLVAFSNGPRSYVLKVLDNLGMLELFGNNHKDGAFVWAVDDVLPHCKPEPEAFRAIFDKLAAATMATATDNNDAAVIVRPEECVMVEDSMKNVRAAKALGMKTILITGSVEEGRILPEDAPSAEDPSVDVAFATVEEMTTKLPGLWEDPPVFSPP